MRSGESDSRALGGDGIPTQTGKFRDIAELGKGGMGDVFLTVAPGPVGFNKLLVVKRLRESLADDPEFLRMFLNEARLAARLNHPNIVHTYEVGFDGSRHYIAMEYLEGQCLHRLVRRAARTGGLPLEMQLRVLADALAGLHYAHELTDYDGTPLEMVHRDISPANIFVLYNGQVKLVDFGIAKTAGSAETKAGIFKGKIQYVSPEQYSGGPLDRRADIYSAGVVLWEAVTQRRMWKDAGDLTVMQRVAAGDVPLPSTVNPQVPARLEAMCMKALAVSKEARYPTAAALQADIEELLREMGSRVTARDVGALTAETFADDRAHLKVLIEDQLRIVRDYPELPSLVPTVMLPQDTSNRPTVFESIAHADLGTPETRRRKMAVIFGGAVAALVAGLLVWPSSSSTDATHAVAKSAAPVESASPPPPASVTAPSAPPAVAPQTVAPQTKLIVETTPRHVRVSVDDAFLPASGDPVRFLKDGALHKVRAEAQGFKAKAEWVRFDSDEVTVQINLDPGAPRKGKKDGAGESNAPSPAPSSSAEIDSSGKRRSATPSTIDTADPWKFSPRRVDRTLGERQ
jgi:serine/threonine protein kinase